MSEAPRGLRGLRALRQRWASPHRASSSAAEPSPPAEPPEDQGTEWSDFIKKELDREYTRRDTLNTRAAGAITSATTLITVSLAVIGIAKGAHYVIDGPELPKLTPGAKYAPPAAGPAAVAGLAALRTGACRPERGERGRVVVCGGRAEPSALG